MQFPIEIETKGEGKTRRLHVMIGSSTMVLDGRGIDDLIEHLAYFRAAMLPKVSDAMSLDYRYHITVDPCWYVERNLLMVATVIFLRHVGLGWNGFALPEKDCTDWLAQLRAAVQHIETTMTKGSGQW